MRWKGRKSGDPKVVEEADIRLEKIGVLPIEIENSIYRIKKFIKSRDFKKIYKPQINRILREYGLKIKKDNKPLFEK
jgi:hypothetical protein